MLFVGTPRRHHPAQPAFPAAGRVGRRGRRRHAGRLPGRPNPLTRPRPGRGLASRRRARRSLRPSPARLAPVPDNSKSAARGRSGAPTSPAPAVRPPARPFASAVPPAHKPIRIAPASGPGSPSLQRASSRCAPAVSQRPQRCRAPGDHGALGSCHACLLPRQARSKSTERPQLADGPWSGQHPRAIGAASRSPPRPAIARVARAPPAQARQPAPASERRAGCPEPTARWTHSPLLPHGTCQRR